MVRRRMLNPDFFTDPDIVASLDTAGRLLYPGIWCVADDSGCFELNPLLLKMKVLPGDEDITTDDIQDYLDTLIELEKIIVYEVDGKEYGWLKNFHKHQSLNKPNSPTVPLPDWIIWHGEEEFKQRHERYYEVNYKKYKEGEKEERDSGNTSDIQSMDCGKTEDRQEKDTSCPEEKRKEEKLKEKNNKRHSSDSDEPNDSGEDSDSKNDEPQFDEDSKPYKAACYLREKILNNNPRANVPDENPEDMEKWALAMDRLNRLGPPGGDEGYNWQEIAEIIDWCQADQFWSSNILSAGKLREKVITLENQMQRKKKKKDKVVNFGSRDRPTTADNTGIEIDI